VYSNLCFYDIRLPDERLAQYYSGEILNDFALFNKYIVTASNDSVIKVINFNNLDNIYIIDSLKLEGPCQSLIVKDFYVYALSTNQIFVIDGSDINNFKVVNIIRFTKGIDNFIYYSDKLYVGAGEKCLIFDIKNPAEPHLTDSLLFDSYSYKLALNDNYLYSMNSREIDVYNLNNKKEEWSLVFPNSLVNFSVFDKLGLAFTYGGAYLLNLEYPSKPAVLEMIAPYCDYGIIRGDYIYLLSNGLKVYFVKKSTK
jgi:hypothetical protein